MVGVLSNGAKVADIVNIDARAIKGFVRLNAIEEVHPRLSAGGVVRAWKFSKLQKHMQDTFVN